MALDVRAGLVTHVVPAGALGAQRARYLPITEHGLIGDLHTVALVGTDVGPYSEAIGPTGEQLGDFRQAFTHLALIGAAYNLDRELG